MNSSQNFKYAEPNQLISINEREAFRELKKSFTMWNENTTDLAGNRTKLLLQSSAGERKICGMKSQKDGWE